MPKLDILMGYLVANKFLVFSVVETNLRTGSKPKHSEIRCMDCSPDTFPLHEFVGRSRFQSTGVDQDRGGTGLFIHHSLDFSDISDQVPKGLECTLVTFQHKNLTFVFASVYLPQRSSREIDLFDEFLDILCGLGGDCILVTGDFNAHHPAWGDSTNKRGVDLYATITSHGLAAGKVPQPTRRGDKRQRDTIVDFFITNRVDLLGNTEVCIPISDHFVISNTFRISGQCKIPRRRVYDFYRSWRFRSSHLNQRFDCLDWKNSFLGATFDSIPSILNSLVLGVWDKDGISKFINSNLRPWFSRELKQIRKRCRSLERRYKAMVRSGREFSDTQACKSLQEATLDKYFRNLRLLRTESDLYISKLLQGNLHGTVRKLYKCSRRAIPTLKHKELDGSFTVLADSDISKANIFSTQFLTNTEIPDSFSVTGGERGEVYDRLNSILTSYSVGDSGNITHILPCGDKCLDKEVFFLSTHFLIMPKYLLIIAIYI